MKEADIDSDIEESKRLLENYDDDEVMELGGLEEENPYLPPFFQWNSFTVYVTVIEIIYFIVSLVVRKEKINYSFDKYLEPPACALYVLGAKWTSAIRYDMALYRLVLPVFLHGGLFHILSNILCQIYLGFLVEKALSSTELSTKVFNSEITAIGSLKVCICYFVSSIGGVILSAVGDPMQLTIGASCAVCGLIGVLCSFLFLIWLKFLAPSCFCWSDNGRKDIQLFRALCIFSILVAFLTGLSGILTPATDNLGHLGGFVIGFLFAPSLMPSISSKSDYLLVRNYRSISLFLSALYFVTLFYTLFTMRVNRVVFKCD
jgi:membrane associated rhomboid family serine protease